MILLLCWVFPTYLTDTGIVKASFKRAISMRDEGEVKREKKNNRLSNGILQVICIFHRQKIWLGCKFDNFKWQRQLASTRAGTATNSASSTSAAAAIYAFKWQHDCWWWWWGSCCTCILYLVSCISYLQDAFCRCADCQVCLRPVLIKSSTGRIIMPRKL